MILPQPGSKSLPSPPFTPHPTRGQWPLNRAVNEFFDGPSGGVIPLLLEDWVTHLVADGRVGSGKTSGWMDFANHTAMAMGAGVIAFTVKPSDWDSIERIAVEEGLADRLFRFGPKGNVTFNPFTYRRDHPDAAVQSSSSFYPFIQSVSSAANPGNDGRNDPFWTGSTNRMSKNIDRIMRHSGHPYTMRTVVKFLGHWPETPEEVAAQKWIPTIFGQLLQTASDRTRGTTDQREVDDAIHYWTVALQKEPPVTTGGVIANFHAIAEVFNDPILQPLFEPEQNALLPEHLMDGAILVIDLPILTYGAVGRVAAAVWRFFAMQAVQNRKDPNGPDRRPVVFIADELASHVDENLYSFLGTARETRGIFCAAYQNRPSLLAAMGGKHNGEAAMNALLGNFGVHIHHNQNCIISAKAASESIGKHRRWKAGGNQGKQTSMFSTNAGNDSLNLGIEEAPWVEPAEFLGLATGGPDFDFIVEAIIHIPHRSMPVTGKPYVRVAFVQSGAPATVAAGKRTWWRWLLDWLSGSIAQRST